LHQLAPALPLLTLHFVPARVEINCNISFLTMNMCRLPADLRSFGYFDLEAMSDFLRFESVNFLEYS
jgi:hypothetical protein